MDHAEIQELLGAYALDAVDPDEAEQIERHLAGCAAMRGRSGLVPRGGRLMGYSGAPAPPGLVGPNRRGPGGAASSAAAGSAADAGAAGAGRGCCLRGAPLGSAARATPAAKTVSARVFTAVRGSRRRRRGRPRDPGRSAHHPYQSPPGTVATQLMVRSYQTASSEFDARHVSLPGGDGSTAVPAVDPSERDGLCRCPPTPPSGRRSHVPAVGADGGHDRAAERYRSSSSASTRRIAQRRGRARRQPPQLVRAIGGQTGELAGIDIRGTARKDDRRDGGRPVRLLK